MHQLIYKNMVRNINQINLETATLSEILYIAMEEIIKNIRRAKMEFKKENKNQEIIHDTLTKAQGILFELLAGLNIEAGELAENLGQIYVYAIRLISEVIATKNADKLNDIETILMPIMEAWKELAKN